MNKILNKNKQTNTNTHHKAEMSNFPIWIPLIIFALTTVIFFWNQLTGSAYFWEDFTEYVYPVQSFATTEFAKNGLPFWNPYTFNGMPFLADLQVGFFYPFYRLLGLFVSDGQLSVWGLQFVIILHFFIAQVSMYLLTRVLKISSIGGIISAIAFAFSGLLVFHVIHPMIIFHLAWFPLVVASFYLAIKNAKFFWSIIAGLILGMSMLSGHPQITLYEVFFLGIFFIFLIFQKDGIGEEHLPIAKKIIAGVVPMVIAIGIFAIQLLPSQELANLSQRADIDYKKASEGSLSFTQALTAVAPKAFGEVSGANEQGQTYFYQYDGKVQRHFYWETAFYFGVATLFLGILGLLLNRNNKLAIFLGIMSLFGFLYALGSNFFLFDLFFQLPFFNAFRNPVRMMFMTSFAMSILAGFAFTFLETRLKDLDFTKFAAISLALPLLMVVLVLAGLTLENGLPEEIVSQVKSAGGLALFVLLAVFAIAFAVNKKMLNAKIGGSLIIFIIFFDLSLAGINFNANPRNPLDNYQIDTELKNAFTAKDPNEQFRVNMRMYQPVSYMAMNRNQGMLDRIQLIEGYNPLILQKVLPPLPSRETVNDIYNVKYEIGVDLKLQQPRFYERQNTFPRAWYVNNAVSLSESEMESAMKNETFNLRKTVLLEEKPAMQLSGDTTQTEIKTAKFLTYNSNEFTLESNANQNQILCLSEIYYPAWKAYIDDKEVKIHRANYSFRAIEVPSGNHKIRFVYESGKFNTGKYITIATLLLAVVGLFFTRRMG